MNDKVKLIAITKPEDDTINVEEFLAYVARVSNPSNQNNKETATKLIKYLISNDHWSPLEMVHIVIEIQTTRTIGRQILRHRSFSFQEFSQRYAEVNSDMFISDWLEARLQDKKNRQNSLETTDEELIEQWEDIQGKVLQYTTEAYTRALGLGVAKEQARAVLPEGMTMSRMYMAGTLRSWVHYCALRGGNGTQKEHKEIALKCWAIIMDKFPSLKDIFTKASQ